jgi:hypothetical protein
MNKGAERLPFELCQLSGYRCQRQQMGIQDGLGGAGIPQLLRDSIEGVEVI